MFDIFCSVILYENVDKKENQYYVKFKCFSVVVFVCFRRLLHSLDFSVNT